MVSGRNTEGFYRLLGENLQRGATTQTASDLAQQETVRSSSDRGTRKYGANSE